MALNAQFINIDMYKYHIWSIYAGLPQLPGNPRELAFYILGLEFA